MINKSVQRKPCGRICRIIDKKPGFYKIHDIGFWTGWLSLKTFENKWQIMGI